MKKLISGILTIVLVCCSLMSSVCEANNDTENRKKQLFNEFLKEAVEKADHPEEWELADCEGNISYKEKEAYLKSRAIGEVNIIKGTMPATPETANGAHYYAFSPNTTDYSYSAGIFELPTSLNTTTADGVAYDNRTAYISGGFLGLGYGVDIGIRNNGGNWHPYYYDGKTGAFVTFDGESEDDKAQNYEADSSAVIAAFFIMPHTETEVMCYITFYDSEDNPVVDFVKMITVGEGNIAFVDGKAYGRFYRFISLIKPDYMVDNQQDETYMMNAGFSELTIHKHIGGDVDWGISTEHIENAWLVSPERIQLEYGINSETASIEHWSE